MSILAWLGALTALLLLEAACVRRFAMSRLTYVRGFARASAFPREEVTLVEVISNRKLLPIPLLKVEARLSPHLRFQGAALDEGLHEIAGDAYHRSVFSIRPYAKVTRRHKLHVMKRGRYDMGTVALTAGDLFGLSDTAQQRQVEGAKALGLHGGISVYPRLLQDGELALPTSRWQGDLRVKRWIAPDPFFIGGIREWQAGDAQRDIHWPATARMGRLQVKAREYTADPRLLVILNVQMDELQWSELMDYEQAVIEGGISLAATLCLRALSAGVEAGFAANAPMGEELAAPIRLWPARYPGRDQELLEVFARLRIHRVKSFPTFLQEMGHVTGMDILILSAYDSQLLQDGMAALRRKGNSVGLLRLQEVGP